MSRNKLLFLTFFSVLFFFNAIAQDERTAISLKQILEEISRQHQVKFNYIEDEIVLFKLIPPQQNWTFEAKLNYIKKETNLQIKVVSNKYYTIYNDEKLDKPLCGFIIDSQTNLPIENCSIIIKKTNAVSFSNIDGYFELPLISSNAILIKHMSYETIEVNPTDLYVSNCPKIKLNPVTLELQEVATESYLTSGISKKSDGTIQIKPKKFGILAGLIEPDVLQTMQQIPGVYSLDETVSNINVRGGTHDQNLFLWNGIRMFQTGHFFGLISVFNPSLAQTISITKNGTSAFYGESVSSLVAISSHSKNIEETKNSFSANLISAELYSKLKISKNASIEISARRSLTDFFKSPTYKNYRDRIFQNTIVTNINNSQVIVFKNNEDFYFYDFSLQYQQKIGKKHELTVDGIGIKNNLKINQSTNTKTKNDNLGQEDFGGSISWKTNWNDKNTTEILVSNSYYKLKATNESIESNQNLNQNNTVLDFNIQLKNSNILSENFTLNSGYQLDEIGVANYDEINSPAFKRNIKSVLISHIGIIESVFESKNKKTFLKTGIRGNYFQKFNKTLIEPRFQFNQKVTKNLNLEILGEQKSQTLSQIIDLQQDFLGIEKRRWTLANDSIIPIQKSNQLSVGFSYKNKNWLFTLDNFYKRISAITSSSQGFQNQFEFSKANGSYEVIGSEVLVQKKFNHFYTWFSYSLNKNNYDFSSLYNTNFPNNFELIHTLNWAGIYEWKKLKIALGGKWHSGKPSTTLLNTNLNDSNPYINFDKPNATNLIDYFQVNFSASKEWNIGKKTIMQTGFSILNILNKNNIINQFYRINANENRIESVNIYSLKRTPNINMKISF